MVGDQIAIFPASGKLGGSLVKYALKTIPAHQVILVARHSSKLDNYRDAGAIIRTADYDAPETLQHAFSEARTLFLISYANFEHEHRSKVRAIE